MHAFIARLLSIAVITETYVRHARNLRPMSDEPADLLHTHTSNK